MSVDIQGGHQDGIYFDLSEYADFINSNARNNIIIFMFNGEDLGYESLSEYQAWLFDIGIDEDVIENAIFIEKSYGFFRYPIDNGLDQDCIVDFVKYLYENNIYDSRDMDSDMFDDFMDKTNHNYSEIRELMEYNDELVSIPDLMNDLENYNDIILIGGGINECLKEIEIALLALDKEYEIYKKFTY